jgi:hypothetical protein
VKTGTAYPTPPSNADGCENKGVAGKAIRKTMKTKGGQNGDGVTNLQTGSRKRVRKLLIPGGAFGEAPPTRVFWQKRLQAIENKGRESQKENKEAATD